MPVSSAVVMAVPDAVGALLAAGSAKSTTISARAAPVTALAATPLKAPLPKPTPKLLMSFALACALALPVNFKVAVVALVRVISAVRPAGVLENVTPDSAAPSLPLKLPLARVMVDVIVNEPSLAAASVKLVVLYLILAAGVSTLLVSPFQSGPTLKSSAKYALPSRVPVPTALLPDLIWNELIES